MDTAKKKSDFELIMEAIEALPSGPRERKHVDPEKIRVIGDKAAFLKAIDKDGYQIKSLLGHFIDDLHEIFTYYVSTARATLDDWAKSTKSAMNEAIKSLPVSPGDIMEMLFCVCHSSGMTFYEMCSVNDFILGLSDDVYSEWNIVFDKDVPETQVKVILVAMV